MKGGVVWWVSTDLGARLPVYKPHLCHFLAALVIYGCITDYHQPSG